MRTTILCCLLLPFVILTSGCATFEKAKRADSLEREVAALTMRNREDRIAHEQELAGMATRYESQIAALNTDRDTLIAGRDATIAKLEAQQQKDAEMKQLLGEREQAAQELLQQKEDEIRKLIAEKERSIAKVEQEKKAEVSALEQARNDLAESLQKELHEYKAKLEMTERGLVLTFLAEIFFDSGKDVIRDDAKDTLQKVAHVLNTKIVDSTLAVEGHTDNVPIQYSGWKSNWELSTSRALAVLHYFVDEAAVNPHRLSAVGYGEFHPVASNDNAAGRQQNRRVEIVIMPNQLQKVRTDN